MTRRWIEILAILAIYIAIREVLGIASGLLQRPWPELAGIPFYALWIGMLGVVAWRPGWVARVRPPRDVWSPVNVVVVIAATAVTTELFYGFRVTGLITGALSLHAPVHWSWLVDGVLLAPLVEEWLFRGVLWDAIASRLDGAAAVLVPLVVTSVLFGTWHWVSIVWPSWYGSGNTPVWVHMGFAAMLGIVRWRLRAIGPGMALHALGNAFSALT